MDTTLVSNSSPEGVTPRLENPSVVLHEGKLTVSVSGVFKEALVTAIKGAIQDQLPLAHELEVRLDPNFAMVSEHVAPAAVYLARLTGQVKKERAFSASLVNLTEEACSALEIMRLHTVIGLKTPENTPNAKISIPDSSPTSTGPWSNHPAQTDAYTTKFEGDTLTVTFNNAHLSVEDFIHCQDVLAKFIDRKFNVVSVDIKACKTILPEHIIACSQFSKLLAKGGMIDLVVSPESNAAEILEKHTYLAQFIKLLEP